MASLPARQTASFFAIQPIPSAAPLDGELDALVGTAGFLKGGTTGIKLLFKTSDASDPPLECDQVGAGPLAEWKQNGTLKASIGNDGQIISAVTTGTSPLSVASTTVVTNLNADKLDGKHAAEWTTLWSATFLIADIAARGVDADFTNIQGALIAGANITCTHISVKPSAGTASGSFTIAFRKHPFADQTVQTTLGSITLNSGTIGVGSETDIADHTFTANDFIFPVISAISSPLHKSVWVTFKGFQTLV